jgi:hypothetical protein
MRRIARSSLAMLLLAAASVWLSAGKGWGP